MPHLQVLCNQGTHCATCRATGGGGPGWRAAIFVYYTVHDGYPEACPKGLPLGWVPENRCDQCGADWHETKDCPIDPSAKPTSQDATAGGCGCAGDQQHDAGDRPG
jgi:hypothetical protein